MSFDPSQEFGVPRIEGDVLPSESRYDVPLVPHDDYAVNLLTENGLAEDASLSQVKPVAEALWNDEIDRKHTVAELILGVQVTEEMLFDSTDQYGFEVFCTLVNTQISFDEAWTRLSHCRLAFLPKSNPDGFRPPLDIA